MIPPDSDQRLVGPPWGVADFVLVMLSGFLGVILLGLLVLNAELSPAMLVVLSTIGMSGGHAAGIWAVLRRRSAQLVDLAFDVSGRDGLFIFLGVTLQVVLAVLLAPLAELAGSDGTSQVVADQIRESDGFAVRMAIVVLVGLVAPIMEELTFRGVLLKALSRKLEPWVAVTVTAAVFSVFHWVGVDQSNLAAGLITLGQLFVVGVALGALTVRHGRLGPAIFTHAGFNLVTVLFLFFADQMPA